MKLTSPLKLLGLSSVIGLVLLFAGCGGGGGGDNNLAPVAINGRTLNVSDPVITSVSVAYTFTATTYTATPDSGNYTYARNTTPNTAKLDLAPSAAPARTLQLVFLSANSGTYTETTAPSPNTGTFTLP